LTGRHVFTSFLGLQGNSVCSFSKSSNCSKTPKNRNYHANRSPTNEFIEPAVRPLCFHVWGSLPVVLNLHMREDETGGESFGKFLLNPLDFLNNLPQNIDILQPKSNGLIQPKLLQPVPQGVPTHSQQLRRSNLIAPHFLHGDLNQGLFQG